MVAYHHFVELCQSGDSEARGKAAHLAAAAYLSHRGPADERAALYAALIGFLDDPSVKVRAALAYGLLHAADAPRPILLALLQDTALISRAVAQYSPALLDADLLGLVAGADPVLLMAVAMREGLSERLAEAVLDRGDLPVAIKLASRDDVSFRRERLIQLAQDLGHEARLRGVLLARKDLPALARLRLVECIRTDLSATRLVRGAIAPRRLQRLLDDATSSAITQIGETEASRFDSGYAAALVEKERVSTRLMLHAIISGNVLFFADCLAILGETPTDKVFTLLETGSRAALNALLARCGLGESVRNLVARLIFHARAANLADDVAARHFVVTALTEELIIDHGGRIPVELEDAFRYLSEQNVALARKAAQGVMSAFVVGDAAQQSMLALPEPERLALPAA